MRKPNPPRRLLIVDDQQAIHDSFDRIFAAEPPDDEALSDFETRFLGADSLSEREKQRSQRPCYELQHAHSGEEAAAMVRHAVETNDRYAVAFVDMRMPQGLDGMETTELLWSIDPDLHIVICTAYSDHIWENVLHRLGYNDRLLLLKKPFESDEARQLALALSEKSRLSAIQRKRVRELGQEVERRRQAERAMRDMAHRDALTRLPNRPYLIKKLIRLAHRAGDGDRSHHAVLFLDLDNFKIINDSLGHDAGDELLNQVAARLKECVRNHGAAGRLAKRGETVRLGGDEFVVLCESIDDREQVVRLAEKIVTRIAEPFQIGDRLVNIGTSVGVAFLNEMVRDAHEALRNADTAMYRAKNSGKGRVAVFDHTMRDDLVARLELEDALRAAVEQETFKLNYQPIVDLRSGEVLGAEALLRWNLADGRSIPPSQFLPMIEEIGLSARVGEWVLERTMREFMEALDQHGQAFHSTFYLGVNISRQHLSDPLFFERLDNLLLRIGFERHRLKLEINESKDTRSEVQVLQTMRELHQSGIAIQIDDFGKGYSSLTCFQDYPIAAVKIDQSFTASIATDHSHAVIARAIVQLAHHLNAGIIAEGVNSLNQLECLRKWGCNAAQGSLFSPPLDTLALCELMQDPLRSDGIRMLRSTPVPSITIGFDHSASAFNTIS